MDQKKQLIAIVALVVALTSATSHGVIRWLGIVTAPTFEREVKADSTNAPMLMVGSSLMLYDIDWETVAHAFNRNVISLTAPSASPCELDAMQKAAPESDLFFVGVSSYDLNEYFLGDFRAEIVPATQAVQDLWSSDSDWQFAKRVLSQYPLTYLRQLIPTAGRSLGVMVGLRSQLRQWARLSSGESLEAGPTMSATSVPEAQQRITDWSPARTLRNLAQLRGACRGRQAFNGPKMQALQRMLRSRSEQGRVVILVLPVSPPYVETFLDAETTQRFEAALAELQRALPQAQLLRLDQLPELQPARLYWDLVHLNVEGKAMATERLLARMTPEGVRQP